MRYTLLVITILLFVTGCDKQVSKKVVASQQVQRVDSCEDGPAGLCYKCDYTFSGNYKCWTGLHLHCPGTQKNLVQLDQIETVYQKSDNTTYSERTTDSTLISHETSCQ